ncbi:MAG: hypothetical protein D6692_04805 [Planctomycetota bacterium]|nr:MAG: hypothetical protein D6692_04805 [Planctomycetota bacterium]
MTEPPKLTEADLDETFAEYERRKARGEVPEEDPPEPPAEPSGELPWKGAIHEDHQSVMEPDPCPEPVTALAKAVDENDDSAGVRAVMAMPEMKNRITLGQLQANYDWFRKLALAHAHATGDGSAKSVAQLLVKIVWGTSLGFSPAAAFGGIHFVEGVPTLGAHAIAALVKAAGWKIQVRESDPPGQWCEVTLTKPDEPPVVFKYTMEMAQQQGLVRDRGPYKKHPWNMLYARALAVAGRRAAPEMLTGLYVREEMDLMNDDAGRDDDMRRRLGLDASDHASTDADETTG